MENQEQKQPIKVYTYRYMWKNKDNGLCVKFITGVVQEHNQFMDILMKDENIVSALREYVNEIDYSFIGWSQAIKEENKSEVKNNEEI